MRRLGIILCFFGVSAFSAPSVYEVNPTRDLVISGVGLAGGLIPYLFADEWIKPRGSLNSGEVNSFDRNAIGNRSDLALAVSDVLLGASLVGPVILDGSLQGLTPEFWEDTIVYVQTLSTAGALVSITKVIAQRPLPRTYAGQPDLVNSSEGYRSFYSGHATMTFAALSAAAVTANLRHHLGPWPWVITGAVGTTVAVSRVLGGVHFPTDVIAGAAMGIGIGTLIPLLHSRSSQSMTMLMPIDRGAKLVFAAHF